MPKHLCVCSRIINKLLGDPKKLLSVPLFESAADKCYGRLHFYLLNCVPWLFHRGV